MSSDRMLSRTASNASSTESAKPANGSRITQTPSTPSALSRTRSARTTPSSAAAARMAGRKGVAKDENVTAENTNFVEELKEQLRKTESASEEYQKQLIVVQSRLEEALGEQTRLEESSIQCSETIAALKHDVQELQRSGEHAQSLLEREQSFAITEREAAAARESELNDVIVRLKDTLAQRESDKTGALDGTGSHLTTFSGPMAVEPDGFPTENGDLKYGAQLSLQKDRMIEEMKLELAEAHVKIMEVERAGGGRLQELERKLLEVRMENAKLMEDNESYQYLLQEKTISGGMMQRFSPTTPTEPSPSSRTPSRELGIGNLADELGSVVSEEDDSEHVRRKLEQELSAQKEENKALTLYINKIIGRLLANDKFEQLFENGDMSGDSPPSAKKRAPLHVDKELPAAPSSSGHDSAKDVTSPPSLLTRAGSIFGARSKVRPKSQQPSAVSDENGSLALPRASIDLPGEDQDSVASRQVTSSKEEESFKAPPIPVKRGNSKRLSGPRGHYRTASDTSSPSTNGTIKSGRLPSGGTLSPPPPFRKRNSLATPSPPQTSSEDSGIASQLDGARELSVDDVRDLPGRMTRMTSDSAYSDGVADTQASPPRSHRTSMSDNSRQSGSGAIVSGGKQMRPLRLVQEKVEAEEERKRANRTSWMGWFNKGAQHPSQAPSAGQNGPTPPTK